MFSSLELQAIKDWAEVGKTMLSDHMSSKVFTDKEKLGKLSEYETLESVIETVEDIQATFISVDADHVMHMLNICKQYNDKVKKQCEEGYLSAEDYAAERYAIGYMQGRLELGLVIAKDLIVITEWEDSLE